MHSFNKALPVLDRAPSVFQINAAVSNALDFGAAKLYPTLEFFKHKILMVSLSIVRNLLCRLVFAFRHIPHFLSGSIKLYHS